MYVVEACSGWYAISTAALRSTFIVALAAAISVCAGTLWNLHGWLPAASLLAAGAISFGLLGFFVFVSLRVSCGWRFDLSWSVGWAVAFVLLNPHALHLPLQWHGLPASSELIRASLVPAVQGALIYAVLTGIGTAVAAALFAWTTSLKKRHPEEEIIQTLALVVARLNITTDWAVPAFRMFIARQIDWIADRIEYDLFRSYSGPDAFATANETRAARKIAAAVRNLRQEVLLPGQAQMTRLHGALVNMLQAAALGEWLQLPANAEEPPPENRSERYTRLLRSALSIGIPAGIASMIYWSPLAAALKTSAEVPLLGLSIVNLLSVLNPSGFDKQITAAKTISDAISGGSK